MLRTITTHLKRFKHEKRGVSNVIVVMLSLVILVIISANVILWSYKMNQLDWEKMNEDITITDITRVTNSSWFATQSEYTVNTGSRISGNYTDTQAVDDSYERYKEAPTSAWSYNPSEYTLGGSTSLVSGSVSNLTSDDDAYMTFTSYHSGNTTIQPIANMNFTSDATGWVYGEANDANNFASGAWSFTGGNGDPGCYDLMVDDTLANQAFDVEQWVNYTFTVDTIPLQAMIYASYRYTSDDAATGTPKIKLVRPDGGVVDIWTGSTVTLSTGSDTGHNYVSVDATSNFTSTGTYQLSLYTHTDSLKAADKPTVHNYWDDAGIALTDPIYTAEVEFTGSSDTEDWTQLNWTINSAWTIGSVNVTLQLYNYTLNNYPTNGNGYIHYTSDSIPNTDETKNQTITVNPTHFRNSTGYWKMKAKGVKVTNTQFDFKADWIELKSMAPAGYRLDMNGTFALDLSTYPLDYIQTVEIQLKYRSNDTGENWYLEAYNWTAVAYSDSGFNNTSGHTPTTGWDTYAVNLTDRWRSYVNDSGVMYVKLQDGQADVNQTTIDIDFLAVRVVIDGAKFTFENEETLTSHLVSLWINNSTLHQRYNINVYINCADTTSYIRSDITLPSTPYTVKVVTERGNTAVFTSH